MDINSALLMLKKEKNQPEVIEYTDEQEYCLGSNIDGTLYEITESELTKNQHRERIYSDYLYDERAIYNKYMTQMMSTHGIHINCGYNKPHPGTIGITNNDELQLSASPYGPNLYITSYKDINNIIHLDYFNYCIISYLFSDIPNERIDILTICQENLSKITFLLIDKVEILSEYQKLGFENEIYQGKLIYYKVRNE